MWRACIRENSDFLWRQKIRFVTALDLINCLKQIKEQRLLHSAHPFLSYHLIYVPCSISDCTQLYSLRYHALDTFSIFYVQSFFTIAFVFRFINRDAVCIIYFVRRALSRSQTGLYLSNEPLNRKFQKYQWFIPSVLEVVNHFI